MRTLRSATAILLSVFVTMACGSDDDENGSGGGATGAAAQARCLEYCDATASCALFAYTDAAECKSYECDGLDQVPNACGTAFKDYYDCVLAKSDVCDETGCEVDIAACS